MFESPSSPSTKKLHRRCFNCEPIFLLLSTSISSINNDHWWLWNYCSCFRMVFRSDDLDGSSTKHHWLESMVIGRHLHNDEWDLSFLPPTVASAPKKFTFSLMFLYIFFPPLYLDPKPIQFHLRYHQTRSGEILKLTFVLIVEFWSYIWRLLV